MQYWFPKVCLETRLHKGPIGPTKAQWPNGSHKGPQRANRRRPGALPKTPENHEFPQKLGSGGFGGETGSPKHVLDTVPSIWLVGFPEFWIVGSIPTQNHVFHVSQHPGRRSSSCLRRPRIFNPILKQWGPWDFGVPHGPIGPKGRNRHPAGSSPGLAWAGSRPGQTTSPISNFC